MDNLRFNCAYEEICSVCNGNGDVDASTNRERKAGIERREKCSNCDGSGRETVERAVQFSEILQYMADLLRAEEYI